MAPYACLLLDHGAVAFRQAVPDSLDRHAQGLGHLLSRYARSIPRSSTASSYPLLGEIRDFFLEEARHIQEGAPEYVFSKEYLGIYWPADEYVFIKLTAEQKFDTFYREAGRLLKLLVDLRVGSMDEKMLDDALRVNRALIKQPGRHEDVVIETSCDVMDFYNGVRQGEKRPMRVVPTAVQIDRTTQSWDDFQIWCREVVWWGNKKGAYLYTNRSLEAQLAGHF